MQLSQLDWGIVGVYFAFVLIVGLMVSRRSKSSFSDYFLSVSYTHLTLPTTPYV